MYISEVRTLRQARPKHARRHRSPRRSRTTSLQTANSPRKRKARHLGASPHRLSRPPDRENPARTRSLYKPSNFRLFFFSFHQESHATLIVVSFPSTVVFSASRAFYKGLSVALERESRIGSVVSSTVAAWDGRERHVDINLVHFLFFPFRFFHLLGSESWGTEFVGCVRVWISEGYGIFVFRCSLYPVYRRTLAIDVVHVFLVQSYRELLFSRSST